MTGFAVAAAALAAPDATAVPALAEASDPAAPEAPDDALELDETGETDDSGRSFFPSFSEDLATGASLWVARRVSWSAGGARTSGALRLVRHASGGDLSAASTPS